MPRKIFKIDENWGKRIDELEKKVRLLEERIGALERGQGISSISLKRG